MSTALVSFSGGMDSATLLQLALSEYEHVIPVSFIYESRHNQFEQAAAEQFLDYHHIKHRWLQLNLTGIMSKIFCASSLVEHSPDAIPEGHYTHESMASTVVPGRNIIFTSILASLAWQEAERGREGQAPHILIGIHSGDHAIYPDCRPEFFQSMERACHHGTDGRVVLKAPFLNQDKTEIIKIGFELGVPYQLTRTCYKDQQLPCGKCGACVERQEAFENNQGKDPVKYAGQNQ